MPTMTVHLLTPEQENDGYSIEWGADTIALLKEGKMVGTPYSMKGVDPDNIRSDCELHRIGIMEEAK